METINVTWILQDGSRKTAAVKTGTNLMQAALDNGVEGIVGQCGGSLACATCHVVVEQAPADLPETAPDEDDMLDKAWGLDPDSRLGCQARLNGEDLVVEIPKYTINMVKENH